LAAPVAAVVAGTLLVGWAPPALANRESATTSATPVSAIGQSIPASRRAALPPPVPMDWSRPVYYVPTTRRVVFITVDDGIDRRHRWLSLISSTRTPVVMFPTGEMMTPNPRYWKLATALGIPVQNHTVSHPDMRWLSLFDQRWQICQQNITVRAITTRRATLFRAPYGAWSATTMWAARTCGMKHVVQWDTVVDHGTISYARGGLRPGSIVLLHLRPEFEQDLYVTLAAARQAGLTPALLTDYLR
jgi:peptidoglycan/xylan/chitin deacetylase (PgdA/CDA1 family)